MTIDPLEINSTTLLPLQIIAFGVTVTAPSYISILSSLQSAFTISKYKNVSFTFWNWNPIKVYEQTIESLYFDGKVDKPIVVECLGIAGQK